MDTVRPPQNIDRASEAGIAPGRNVGHEQRPASTTAEHRATGFDRNRVKALYRWKRMLATRWRNRSTTSAAAPAAASTSRGINTSALALLDSEHRVPSAYTVECLTEPQQQRKSRQIQFHSLVCGPFRSSRRPCPPCHHVQYLPRHLHL